ncbi:unnamed protein product, partial [Symbiodinium sp. CCMP2456]
MPLAERLTRLKRQRGELKGLELDVHTEPGHALVDRVQAMLDSAQVLHIAPDKCISRHDEILGDKSEQKLSLEADGNIKITKQASMLRCETTGELKLRRCFLRRALAFDQVGLASFTALESWHNKMFQALLDAPPAGYRYTTVQQILAADQKLWQVVAQESRGDISISVGLPAPLDKHIVAASNNQFVMSCLTHLPKPPEALVQTWRPHKGGKGDKGENGKGGKGGKGKNKGGKNNQSNAESSPNTSLKELLDSLPEGCVRATEEGRFICPFFNKGICRFQKRKSCSPAAANDSSPNLNSGVDCGPEAVAKRLVQQSRPITAAQLVDLFDALPRDECDRDAAGVSFSAGLYARVKVGLRKACKLFPWTVQAVNRFVASLLRQAVYTSFALFSEVQTREHRDTQNSFLPNYVIPLTSFEGGEITVHESEPPVQLHVSKGPVQFCARHYRHSTAPFQGRRMVLVLFALQAATKATSDDQACLRRLGFPLPSVKQLNSTTVCPSVSVPLDISQRALLSLIPPSASEGCNSLDAPGPSQAKPPVVAECLTSAGPISAAAMLLGWDAAPVGPKCLAAAKTPVISLDVSDSSQLQDLLNFDSTVIVDWWHFPLFLKSCSRARGTAPACRDADNIFGCPSLSDSAAAQVLHDNQLCQAATSILFRAFESKALVSLVGPARSWCWSVLAKCVKTRGPSAFVDWYFNLADQELDTCMYGSPFVTSLLVKASSHAFHGLSLSCDKSHSHRAWTPPHPTVNHFCDMSLPSQLCEVRSAAANQPHYLPSLIPEFKLKLPLAQVPATADFKLLSRTPGSGPGDFGEPESATKRFKAKGGASRGSFDKDAVSLDMAGIYHTMEEHLELACALSCPLTPVSGGVLAVENKPGRLEKISQMLRTIASGKDVSRSDVASLHGLINFAGPFLGNTSELKQACALALDVIAQCRPKRCPASISPPIVLYTDGAYEKGIGTWGAVLIDQPSGARWAFGGTVDSSLVAHWKREAGEQVICQVEAFALAIVLYGIRGSVKGRSILAFIDNDPCRYGFIKRYSPSTSLLRVISLVALLEGSLEALLWFERVPSKSNPADLPSKPPAQT